MTQATWIEERLREVLAPLSLRVEDESHRHRGHPGATGGGHYRVTVVSEAFRGVARVRRHRIVYDAVRDRMGGEIHALAVHALTPEEAAD